MCTPANAYSGCRASIVCTTEMYDRLLRMGGRGSWLYKWGDHKSQHSSPATCLGFQRCHRRSIFPEVLSFLREVIEWHTQTSGGCLGTAFNDGRRACGKPPGVWQAEPWKYKPFGGGPAVVGKAVGQFVIKRL